MGILQPLGSFLSLHVCRLFLKVSIIFKFCKYYIIGKLLELKVWVTHFEVCQLPLWVALAHVWLCHKLRSFIWWVIRFYIVTHAPSVKFKSCTKSMSPILQTLVTFWHLVQDRKSVSSLCPFQVYFHSETQVNIQVGENQITLLSPLGSGGSRSSSMMCRS